MSSQEFYCDKCGLCCQNLNRSSLYDDLNDGNGICVHFDTKSRLCGIYDERPDKCNVKEYYKYVAERYTYEEYINLNIASCKNLKGGK